MPIVRVRIRTPGGEVRTLQGFAVQGVREVSFIDSTIGDPIEVPIVGVSPVPPDPTILARILGSPSSATELTTITTLTAELQLEDGTVVEPYIPSNWTWAPVSGGGSFVGDDLTLPAAPATVRISATHNVENVTAFADIAVVAQAQRVLEIYNVPSSVIQGGQYTILTRELDQATGDVLEDPATGVAFAVDSGPATITNGNLLNVTAGSAPATIQISAAKAGVLGDVATFSVIVQPTFPNNEPPGFTQLTLVDGSTILWPGWTNNAPEWLNPDRVTTEPAPGSKFGNVTRKRFFIGEDSGWHGLTIFPSGAIFKEVYTRLVFRLSSNYDPHIAGDKVFINRKNVGGERSVGNNLFHRNFVVWINHHTRLPGVSDRNVWLNSLPRFIIPGSPPFTGGSGFTDGPFERIVRGQFHTFEILRRMNSAPGVADGLVRIWWDGQEITRFSLFGAGPDFQDYTFGNVEYISPLDASLFPPGISPSTEAPLFWGGQGDTKQVNDFIDISELYISRRN